MKSQKRSIKFLERKEVERLIDGIKIPKKFPMRSLRDRALIEVLFSTGMRIHEALALTVDEMMIVILEEVTSEFPIIGKGGWQRVVYFSPRAKEAVRRYLDRIDDDEEILFAMTSRNAQLMGKRRALEAGIKTKVTPHVFRHSL